MDIVEKSMHMIDLELLVTTPSTPVYHMVVREKLYNLFHKTLQEFCTLQFVIVGWQSVT